MLLLVVSTVVAFRGWPDDLGSSGESISRLAPAAQTPDDATASAVRAAPLALPAVTLQPTLRRGATRDAPGASGGGGTGAPSTGTSGPGVSSPPVQGSAPVTGATGGQTGAPAQRTTSATGDVVRDTTKSVGDLVRPAAPAVGTVVDDVGNTAGDVVDGGNNAVADALGHVGQ